MGKIRRRGERVRLAIIENALKHPKDLVSVVAKKFGVSRQAINRYMQELVRDGYIQAVGSTSSRRYMLRTLQRKEFSAPLSGLEEDRLWREKALSAVGDLPENVVGIWHYAFTEMVNNAIDHSDGEQVTISVERNALLVEMRIHDDGIGIFRKIKDTRKLEDEHHAVLELAKGKLTTDPENHTGEGIFFTSRMLDDFAILSGDVYFSHDNEEDEDWILQASGSRFGTSVFMRLNNHSKRTTRKVFDHFATEDDNYGFTKTVVPVELATYGQDKLVSRSQAKRLLTRMNRFKTVVLDFKNIDFVGQPFIDEIFRVFVRNNPNTLILPLNASPQVERMITHVEHGAPTVEE